jgi:amino-acid N-acetyltransferase
MAITIEAARPADADEIAGLISTNHLPLDGLREHLDTAVVARLNGKVVGVAALEVYKDGVLMRSVAVAPALHGQGLGHLLTNAVLQLARDLEAPHAYLLTTTAEEFFRSSVSNGSNAPTFPPRCRPRSNSAPPAPRAPSSCVRCSPARWARSGCSDRA